MDRNSNFTEWIQWAESTDNIGRANIEPIICEFLKSKEEDGHSLFCGNVWNGENWLHISNSYRNMLIFVLLQNPINFTYAIVLGRSIKEFDYHGIYFGCLAEALEQVPADRWKTFTERYCHVIKNKDALSRIEVISIALVGLIRSNIPNNVPAHEMKTYFETKGMLPLS